jgi:NTE family protein
MDGTDLAKAETPPLRALVLSGGVALGAFEAGAYAALEEAGEPAPDILVGGSAGAVNAAIIAGNPPGARAAALRRFWDLLATDPTPATTFLLGPPPPSGAWCTAYNEASALQTLLLGHPHMFRPRMAPGPRIGEAPSLFDLEPLLARLPDFIDFDRLNDDDGRLALAATDVETGERVVFDTAAGTRIGPRHVVASCALLPVFAPVALEGRLLADAEVASLLAEARRDPPLTVVRIGYRGARDEAGPCKLFDYSAATLADRWAAGEGAMRQALQRLRSPATATTLAEGLLLHEAEATLAAA